MGEGGGGSLLRLLVGFCDYNAIKVITVGRDKAGTCAEHKREPITRRPWLISDTRDDRPGRENDRQRGVWG